jgi:histidinol-phosphatase (PHP family)
MYDYHMHSNISFDSAADPMDMARAALDQGLKDICFTDHYDHHYYPHEPADLFSVAQYRSAYDELQLPGLQIHRGVEFGLTRWNKPHLDRLLQEYPFDFVLGSVHFADGYDPYWPQYWENRSYAQAFRSYLEETYHCVQIHDNFDVLGHLTYVCKSVYNATKASASFSDYQEITDEIMKLLVAKGKGMEINTSGVDRVGFYLPTAAYLQRFKELGGEIVTVGSDAHDPSRVGQYSTEALAILREIFGHVCTFEKRQPIFHKL